MAGNLNDVKKNIRSLLTAYAKDGMTAGKLMREYEELLSEKLDYSSFGHRSIYIFLASIPDTVTSRFVQNQMRYFPVACKETAGVQELVLKQKSTARTARRSKPSNRYARNVIHRYAVPKPVPRQLSYRGKSAIYDVLRGHPEGLSLKDFLVAYVTKWNVYLNPEEHGFKSHLDLLSSLSPKVKTTWESGFFTVMLSEEAGYRNSNYSRSERPNGVQNKIGAANLVSSFNGLSVREAPAVTPAQSQVVNSSTSYMQAESSKRKSAPAQQQYAYNGDSSISNTQQNDVLQNTSREKVERSRLKDKIIINDVLRRNLQRIMEKYPDGIFASKLPLEYEKMFNLQLDCFEYSTSGFAEFAFALPTVFQVVKWPDCEHLLFDARINVPQVHVDCVVEDESKWEPECEPITCDIKVTVFRVVKNHPNGLCASVFLDAYLKNSGVKLDISSYGCTEPKEFLQLFDGSALLLSYDEEDAVAFPIERVVWGPDELPTQGPYHLHNTNLEVVSEKEQFTWIDLPEIDPDDPFIQVVVAEIYHPHRFYVQLMDAPYNLDSLMDDMSDFYEMMEGYDMPDAAIFCGQICAAKYDNKWHRGKIIQFLKPGQIRMNFVDFGTISPVKRENMRWLHRQFFTQPAHAIHARSYNISPRDSVKWPVEANEFFYEEIKSREGRFRAYVKSMNFERRSMDLSLLYTCENANDVIMDEVMVAKGYANYVIPPYPDTSVAQVTDRLCNGYVQAEQRSFQNTICQNRPGLHWSGSSVCTTPEPQTYPVHSSSTPNTHAGLSSMASEACDRTNFQNDFSENWSGTPVSSTPEPTYPVHSPYIPQTNAANTSSSTLGTRIRHKWGPLSTSRRSRDSETTASTDRSLANGTENGTSPSNAIVNGTSPSNSIVNGISANDASYVLEIDVDGDGKEKVNVISLNGKTYFASAEISASIPCWKGVDVLPWRLQNTDIVGLVVEKSKMPELFRELHDRRVPWYVNACARGVCDKVTLYDTADLSQILTLVPKHTFGGAKMFGGN